MANRTFLVYNGPMTENAMKSPQFFVKKTDKNLIEIVGAFSIGKIRLGFRSYDSSAEQGSKNKVSIDFYLDISEFELLCHNILSGNLTGKLAKGAPVPAYYKGSPKDGRNISRVLTFSKANRGTFLTVHEGPGSLNSTGAMQPAYDLKGDDHAKLSAMLSNEEIKSFALQGKRACDHFYLHYFGREGERPSAG